MRIFQNLLDLSSNAAIEGLLAEALFKEMSAQIARIDASGSETIQTQLLKFYQSLSAPIIMHTLQEQRLTLRVQALEGGNTILTLTDITQEHDQQRQLEQTNKLATLGEMAAGIAHELNQPLNAIKLTATNLMLQYQRDKSKAEKNALVKLEQINAQIDRASDYYGPLCENLRDWQVKNKQWLMSPLLLMILTYSLSPVSGSKALNFEQRSKHQWHRASFIPSALSKCC